MRQHTLIATLLIALLGLGLATAWAAERPGHRFGNGPCLDGPRGGGPLAHLDLSDEQRKEIGAILDAEREQLRTLREAKEQSREATRAALKADTIDEAKVRRLAHEQADKRVDLQLARQQTRARIDAVLTEEQREQLQQQRQERQQWREERRDQRLANGPRHGKGMHGGPGSRWQEE